MILQRLISKIFSAFIGVLLWLVLIVGVVLGVINEWSVFFPEAYGFRAPDWLVGLVAGFLFDLIILGPIVILIDIRSLLRKPKKPEWVYGNTQDFEADGYSPVQPGHSELKIPEKKRP